MIQNTRRRGRPLAFDPDAALDRAVEVFWRNGPEADTLPGLERAMGLSRSSLYNHFGDKEALRDAALARYGTRIGGAMVAPLETGAGGIDDVLALLDRLAAHADDRSAPAGCLMVSTWCSAAASPTAHASAEAYLARLEEALAAALRRAAAAGEIPPETCSRRATLLRGIVVAVSIASRLEPDAACALVRSARSEVESWRT